MNASTRSPVRIDPGRAVCVDAPIRAPVPPQVAGDGLHGHLEFPGDPPDAPSLGPQPPDLGVTGDAFRGPGRRGRGRTGRRTLLDGRYGRRRVLRGGEFGRPT